MKNLVEAVFFLHQKGICHRDIKPDNCMLANRGGKRPHLVLIDFNVATFHDCMATVTGTVPTTPVFRVVKIWGLGNRIPKAGFLHMALRCGSGAQRARISRPVVRF